MTMKNILQNLHKPQLLKERVVVYDFDGTIFHSPERNVGEITYFEATGEEFPFAGWWGRNETLMPPIVPEKPEPHWYIQDTLNAYKEDSKCPNSELILMTGRPYKNRKRIIELCSLADLEFNRHFFRGQPGQKGNDTFEIKRNFIEGHIFHPNLKIFEIWEDRPEHVSGFLNLSKYWKSRSDNTLEKIIVHDVQTKQNHQI